MRAERLADGHGAMCAAGAAHGDHQPPLSLALIQRQKVIDQLVQVPQKLAGFLLAEHVIANRRFQTGVGADILDIIRVGQEAHVEHQIAFARDAALIAEGHDFRAQGALILVAGEQVVHARAKLLGAQPAGGEHVIGALAQGLKHFALLGDGLFKRYTAAHERVVAPRLLVAVDERFGVRLQKEDGDFVAVAALIDGAANRVRVEQRAAAGIHAEGDGRIQLHLFAEGERGREQQRRNVVHALIAAVLQMAQDARFARAGQAGDDQKFHACLFLLLFSLRPEYEPPARAARRSAQRRAAPPAASIRACRAPSRRRC